MATSNASNFNNSIGSLRERGNQGDMLNKAVSDRLNILKASEPDVQAQKTQETEVKGTEAVGALKTISDLKDAGQKIGKGVDALKSGAQAVSGMVGGSGVSTNAPVQAKPIAPTTGSGQVEGLPKGNPGGAPKFNESQVEAGDDLFSGLKSQPTNTAGLFDRSRSVVQASTPSTPSPMSVAGNLTKGDNLGDMTTSLKSGITNATGDLASGSSNVHSAVQAGANVASKVGDAVEEGASVASKVMTGASAVADALGPVGDLIGLGMAIYGGVKSKGYFKRQQDASTDAQTAIAKPVAQTSTQATSVSLDTSKPAQASAQSHY